MTITRYFGSKALVAIMIATALFILPTTAQAKKKKPKKPKGEQVLFLETRLSWVYDNNIINYSDADLDLYDIGADSTKFAIESKDDLIVTPQIEAFIKGKFIAGHTAWIGLSFKYYYYARNEIRRFQRYGIFGRHYFRPGGYASMEYAYIPDYYYRNQFYQPTGNFVEASFSKHYLRAEIGQDLTSSLKADLSYRFQSKAFNREVSERDLTVHGIRADGIWRATRAFKFWVYYGFETASAKGADNPDLTVRDVSYDSWDFTVGARYYSRLFGKLRPELVSTFQFREIKFQTSKYLDIYRFGRVDHNFYYRIGTSWSLPYKLKFDIDYNYQKKTVDLPVASLISQLEYSSYSISFELARSF